METIWKIRAAVAGTLAVLGLTLTPGCSSGDSNGSGDDVSQTSEEDIAAPGDDMAGMPPPAMPAAAPDMPDPGAAAPAPAPAPTAADGGGAATDELLAMAKTAAPAASLAKADATPEPGANAAPGTSAAADPMSPEAMAMMMQAPGDSANNQAAASQDTAMQAAMEAAMTNDAAAGDGSSNMIDNAMGSPGASGGSGKAPSFKYPITGAQAFIDALKAKDPQKLNDAVALRSRLESSAAHRSVFEQILDSSLPPETIQELADAFEGYKIVRQGAVEGTGHQNVILMKNAGKDNLQRSLTLRKEKAGWKVSDFSGVRKFEGQNIRKGRGRMGRRR
ncbi:MAG: hypothetical protein ABI353_00545 [Isosphaeraceae bacterium]